ncbi:pentatricopeptide repeat-containing protein At1g77360, mitochondrial-like [Magnolia sinica]|uniref:pentatricopeptide repeat-containing protein At1g77360, mitochondrial-like n=1 Tax=Magnolia sinica TaxID=86752 RepID=UPI00265992B7|nr:pentatricopeptide repeat-containing protein At1g77360, mitochondrial-like [Magnolia sinica]
MISLPSANGTAFPMDPNLRNPLLPTPKIPNPPPSSSQTLPPLANSQPFPSYLDVAPTLPPAVLSLCEILSKVPALEVESALTRSGIPPSPQYVEQVLKLSYASPASAVKFFRWAGLNSKHTPHSWNLMVDLLGKNRLFEATWDAIRSMKQEGVLSMATFASVFGSYCAAGKFKEAIMSFDVMDRYDVPQDVVAVNSLLSAICREDNQTSKALEFFERIKAKIPPDADTFAILLEGWEKEGNVTMAKKTFGEMVIRVGWNTDNMSAHDAFLTTLVRGSQAEEAVKFLHVMKGKNCLPGMKFFSNALDILIKLNNATHALSVWEVMVGSGLVPNLIMYNAVIGLLCNNNDINNAFRFLDEMPFNGAFPNSLTYNMVFQCLIRNRKVHEAASFFSEMKKNEWLPTHSNCTAAIKMFFDGYDPEMAVEVWNYMIENRISPMEESANTLLIGLRDLDRMSEVRRFAEEMLDRGIELYSDTMGKLKNAFNKARMLDAYDRIERRWKGR